MHKRRCRNKEEGRKVLFYKATCRYAVELFVNGLWRPTTVLPTAADARRLAERLRSGQIGLCGEEPYQVRIRVVDIEGRAA